MQPSEVTIRLKYLQQLYLQSQRACISISQELQNFIQSTEFLSENVEEFANVLQNIISSIKTELETVYSRDLLDLSDKNSFAGSEWAIFEKNYLVLERRLFYIFHVIARLTPLLKFINGARVNINQWGIIAQVDRLCRNLNQNARVIVRPRWEYMYTYIPITNQLYEISEYAEAVDSRLKKVIEGCIFPNNIIDSPIFSSLAYPPISSNNLLHLAIWGHEIGHFIDNIEGLRINAKRMTNPSPDSFLSENIAQKINVNIDFSSEKIGNLLRLSLRKDHVSTDENILSDEEYTHYTNLILGYRDHWAAEIFADVFAVRLFGPAAIFSLIEFSQPIEGWIDYVGPKHISIRTRLKFMLQAFMKWYSLDSLISTYGNKEPFINILCENITYLYKLAYEDCTPRFPLNQPGNDLFQIIYPVFLEEIVNLVDTLIGQVNDLALQNTECFLFQEDLPLIIQGSHDLENLIPPEYKIVGAPDKSKFNNLNKKVLLLSVNSGWLNWINKLNNKMIDNDTLLSDLDSKSEFDDINNLILKSIEDAETIEWFTARESFGRKLENNENDKEKKEIFLKRGGVLSRDAIVQKMKVNSDNRLIIRPILDLNSQAGSCSFDIRLGNSFVLTKYPLISKLDPSDFDLISKVDLYQDIIHLPFGKPFILHPGQLVLTTSLEYISIPKDLMGMVLDRESWGRLGLVMAIRSKIAPGYKGCITLSLTNIGNAPIPLYPCSRIGQILFFSLI